jgi:type I restriction enzyme, S subunit
MSELAKGWCTSTVGECFLEIKNGTTLEQNKAGVGYAITRIETIQKHRFDLSRIGHTSAIDDEQLATFRYQKGDIALSHINSLEHVGKTALYSGTPEILVHGMNLLRLRLGHSSIEAAFLHYFTRTSAFREAVKERVGYAVNQVSINQSNLREVPLVLAPLAEQRRIVAKLDALLARVDACRQRLDKIPKLLARFRHSVLAAACSGDLTADWRNHAGIEDEPPIYKLGDLGRVTGGITKNAKRGKLDLSVPYLRVANVYQNRLELEDVAEIAVTQAELARTSLCRGDVLFVEGNGSIDQIGRVALWDGSIELCVHQNHLIKFRAGVSVDPTFVLYQMMGPAGRSQLVEKATSSAGLHTLSISKISELLLPVPTLDEQHETVRRVDQLFAFADRLETRVQTARKRVDALTQSILAKAFRGELVPTEAELAESEGRPFESAEQLLDRIRTEREATTTPRKRTPRNRP